MFDCQSFEMRMQLNIKGGEAGKSRFIQNRSPSRIPFTI